MNRSTATLALAALVSAFTATASFAGSVPAPAPLLGAGLPGLAALVVAGGGYLAVRTFRRRRDD
jgi:hypothetical protein